MLVGCTADAAFVIRSRMVGRINYVYLHDVAAYYGMETKRVGRTISMAGSGRELEVKITNRKAKINGIEFDLGYSVREDDGVILISEMDLAYTIDPVLRSWSLPRKDIGRIVIDAGHGGKDSGAVGKRLKVREKDVVLNVALYLKQILEAQGYEVIMTRDTDEFLSLSKRGKFGGDLFISLHCNSASSASASGIETWYCTPKGMPSTYKKKMYTSSVKGNRDDRLNTRLAYEIQRYALHYTEAADRGPRRYRWRVLSQATCPAVLVEMGFLSNSQEEAKLKSASYQQKLALGIASGIISFHRTTASYTQ